jgi:UDP-N-acetylglucosamine--N-acetylmuramyl-(pentapeptide) pyrophosphoryl-undecaprenol N-acetylglucosamine transferase
MTFGPQNEKPAHPGDQRPGGCEGSIRMVVAGGGTGGHLFPGIAAAQALARRRPGSRIRFVGTGRPFETTAVRRAGFDHRAITASGLKGLGVGRQISALGRIPKGLAQAVSILREFAPHLVLGMGGYSAGPVVLAAWLLGIPRSLHEQNRLPGLTNRILGRCVDRVCLSFEESRRHFNPAKCRVTGNPVRRELLAVAKKNADAKTATSGAPPFTLLIFGGSQGAHRINTAMVAALDELSGGPDLNIIHQTGDRDAEWVGAAYARRAIPAQVAPFFSEMADLYAGADLVICRAGATTVAELTAMGKAAVFVPFPHAADDHQTANARTLTRTGAADMIAETELTGPVLARRIDRYRRHPEDLAEMSRKAAGLGRPRAAEAIVDELLALLAEKGRN